MKSGSIVLCRTNEVKEFICLRLCEIHTEQVSNGPCQFWLADVPITLTINDEFKGTWKNGRLGGCRITVVIELPEKKDVML